MSAEIAATISAHERGAIAQLGERLVCNQEVAGSIPAGSTSFPPTCVRRVMTRAHANHREERLNRRERTGSNMCWRDHAPGRVVSGVAQRSVCSLTIRKVFVLTLSFQAKCFVLKLKLENVAFAM